MSIRGRHSIPLSLVALLACSGPAGHDDGASRADQDDRGHPDLRAGRDLRPQADLAPEPDLAQPDLLPQPDLSVPPMLTLPFACPPEKISAAGLWDRIVSKHCDGPVCHLRMDASGGLNMADAAAMKAGLVGQPSETALMPRVTARDVDNSYLLYKLLGEQLRVSGGGGDAMPKGGMLDEASTCSFISWVRNGAP